MNVYIPRKCEELASDDEMSQPADTAEIIGGLVRALMLRKGIPQIKHSKEVAKILNLSVPAVYKYLDGRSELMVSHLIKIADHFKVPLQVLLPLSEAYLEDGIEAILLCGDRRSPCTVWTGAEVIPHPSFDWVAFEEGGIWYICATDAAPSDKPIYFVKRVELRNDKTRAISIAVLDDDEGVANSIAAHLLAAGFQAEAFFDAASLNAALVTRTYHCFVLDWILATETSEELIQSLRVDKRIAVPIYLLTGEYETGRADKSSLQRAVASYGLITKLKPIPMDILTAEIFAAVGNLYKPVGRSI